MNNNEELDKNLVNLRQQIVNKELNHLYIMTGSEIAIRDIYIDQIDSILNLPKVYTDSYEKIRNRILTKSFLSQDSLYIIINDKSFISNEKFFKDFSFITNDYVIFTYDTLDKRSKFYKDFKDNIIEFNYLDEDTLVGYIQRDYPKLIESNCRAIIKKCNNNYARILLELDKINTYNNYRYKDSQLINSGFHDLINYIYDEPKDAIFNLIDQIMLKKPKEAFKLLDYCEAGGESNINIIYNLYNNVRQVFQVQSAIQGKSKDLEKTTGLKPFIINLIKRKCNVYTNDQLVQIMKLLQQIDTDIKKGNIDEEVSVRYAMNKIFSM